MVTKKRRGIILQKLNQDIAVTVGISCRKVSTLPSKDKPTYLDYLKTRIDEVISIWRKEGLEPEYLTVLAASALIKEFSILYSHQGIPIDYVINPLATMLSIDSFDEGTFTLEFTANHPASTWIKPALGIAYSSKVDYTTHHTRWILQEIDGIDPDIAQTIAEKI